MASTIKPHRRPERFIPHHGNVGENRTAAKPIRRRGHPTTRQRKLGGSARQAIALHNISRLHDTPDQDNRTQYTPRRRQREHLTPPEMDRLLKAARSNRYGYRDHAFVLICYTHGLRLSEAIGAVWEDFDLKAGVFHVHRVKGSISGDHFLRGVEIRALRQLKRSGPASGEFVFASERGGRLSARGVQKMIERLAVRAGMGALKVHAHMMRHSCGYYLADRGVHLRVIQEYLGHKNIRHTVRYTALSPRKFRRLWDD